jgi:hypothetical protein
MKIKFYLSLPFFLLCANIFAQINYEAGYYINNQDVKINCLIKNIEWNSCPDSFEYKFEENSTVETAKIKDVKEFSIPNDFRYKRYKVEIDRSSSIINELSNNKAPEFSYETLFLKELVYGNTILYKYSDQNIIRYFVRKSDSEIATQLIYKLYATIDGQSYGKNEAYKQQLYSEFNCEEKKSSSLNGVKYTEKSLTSYFQNDNVCNGTNTVDDYAKESRDWFNLRVRPGVSFSELVIDSPYEDPADFSFGNKTTFRFGVEAEFVLPFNKDKWSIFIEPTYQYYKSDVTEDYYITTQKISIDYQSIEIPLGVGYRMFLNEDNSLILKVSYVSDFNKKAQIEFEASSNFDISTSNNLSYAFGYEFKNKFSIEFRYQQRDFLGKYAAWHSTYNNTSLILGYKLF